MSLFSVFKLFPSKFFSDHIKINLSILLNMALNISQKIYNVNVAD